MKITQSMLVTLAGILATSSGAWAAFTLGENFDTDPVSRGWTGVSNTTGSNNFGFVPSNGAGNNVGVDLASGEAGGLMVRNTFESSYGRSVNGSLPLSSAFSASGSFDVTSETNNGLGYNVAIGFYSSSASDVSFAGFVVAEPGGSVGERLFSWVRFSDGVQRISSFLDMGPIDLADETFSFAYDPSASGGLGALTVNFTGVTADGISGGSRTSTFIAGDKSKGIVLDSFGFLNMPIFASPGNSVNLFMDDVSFTALPEPGAISSLAGFGWILLLKRRRR